LLLNIIPR